MAGMAQLPTGGNTTTFQASEPISGTIMAGLQTGLSIWDRLQAEKAMKIAKQQFNKQMSFAVQNANNQVQTTNNKIASAVNIASSLMNKSPTEAAARSADAAANHYTKEIHV